MIRLVSREQLERAIAKARETKPFVRVIGWRTYEVTNKETGATYVVHFDLVQGMRMASCTCKAGENGRVCYHVAAACGAHLMIAARRAAQIHTLALAA